jgi:drug/metabolite transporter (DMT)-like permease
LDRNLKLGLLFGIFGDFFVGFQPIVANARPGVIDSYIFAAMTCLIEAFIFFPLMLMELKRDKNRIKKEHPLIEGEKIIILNWRKNIFILLFIGLIFGINQLLFFIGYGLAGAINGSLTQKTTVFFGLIFGYVILKEDISKRQIIFSIILFCGLFLAITQGSLSIFYANIQVLVGVLILLFMTMIWMFGHTITKPLFQRKEVSPTQMVFIRNILSGMLLIFTYFIFFPVSNLIVFLNPINIFFFIAMGSVYGVGLWCWYKTLSYLDVSKATIIFSPTPLVTTIFATFFLKEDFTFFHLTGILIVISCIFLIMKEKRI